MAKKTWTDEQLTTAVANSISMRQVLSSLGLNVTGGNYTNISKNIKRLNLDTSHWLGQGHLRGSTHNWTRHKLSNEELFVENSSTARSVVRNRLIKQNLIDYECQICGIFIWLDKPLSLNLDHINGVYNDNRLDNLRFLCPNCDAQTDTYCGRNGK